MKLLQRNEINDKEWDDCINTAPNGLIYGLCWWLDTLCEWEALVEQKGEKYIWVIPLPVRSKGSVKYVYPPFFIQQLGLFGAFNEEDEKQVVSFLNENFKFVEYYFNFGNGILNQEKKNLILPLNNAYEMLNKAYSNNHKRNIKKSKLGLTVKSGENFKSIVQLFRNNRGKDIEHWKDDEYNRFEALCSLALEKGMLVSHCVYKEDELLCGGLFFKHANRYTFLFSGQSNEGKVNNALFVLLDTFIEEKSGAENILDFEGSNNEGLYRFYKGFGANEQNYAFFKHNNLPFYLKWFKK